MGNIADPEEFHERLKGLAGRRVCRDCKTEFGRGNCLACVSTVVGQPASDHLRRMLLFTLEDSR